MGGKRLRAYTAQLASLMTPAEAASLELWRGGSHVRGRIGAYNLNFTIPISPSDHRSLLNNKADLKRRLHAARQQAGMS